MDKTGSDALVSRFIGTEGVRVENLAMRVTGVETLENDRFGRTFRLTLKTPDGRTASWFRKRPTEFTEGDDLIVVTAFVKKRSTTRVGGTTILTHVTARAAGPLAAGRGARMDELR